MARAPGAGRHGDGAHLSRELVGHGSRSQQLFRAGRRHHPVGQGNLDREAGSRHQGRRGQRHDGGRRQSPQLPRAHPRPLARLGGSVGVTAPPRVAAPGGRAGRE